MKKLIFLATLSTIHGEKASAYQNPEMNSQEFEAIGEFGPRSWVNWCKQNEKELDLEGSMFTRQECDEIKSDVSAFDADKDGAK